MTTREQHVNALKAELQNAEWAGDETRQAEIREALAPYAETPDVQTLEVPEGPITTVRKRAVKRAPAKG